MLLVCIVPKVGHLVLKKQLVWSSLGKTIYPLSAFFSCLSGLGLELRPGKLFAFHFSMSIDSLAESL